MEDRTVQGDVTTDHAPYPYKGNRKLPCEGELWKHFKGNIVRVIGISQDTEHNTYSVVYLYEDRLFNRPLAMFMSEVDHEKYPDTKQKYRFERMK